MWFRSNPLISGDVIAVIAQGWTVSGDPCLPAGFSRHLGGGSMEIFSKKMMCMSIHTYIYIYTDIYIIYAHKHPYM